MPESVNLSIADVKAGIKRLLPVIETIARLTPTKTDDAAVAFLKLLLENDTALAAAVQT